MASLKLTEEVHDKIVDLIRAGNYASVAARASGIGERTFWRWMKDGEDSDKEFAEYEDYCDDWNELTTVERRDPVNQDLREFLDSFEFSEKLYRCWRFWLDVKKAEGEAESTALSQIAKAARDGSWQAAAWTLERKNPDRWGRRDRVTHEGGIDHTHRLGISEEDANAARQRLEAAKAKELPAPVQRLTEGRRSDQIAGLESGEFAGEFVEAMIEEDE
jgi:transposase